jgi:hypothetical protein
VGLAGAYMKTALELPVPSELHANHFVKQQAHEVERLRHCRAFVPDFGHGGMQSNRALFVSGVFPAWSCRCGRYLGGGQCATAKNRQAQSQRGWMGLGFSTTRARATHAGCGMRPCTQPDPS